MKDVVFDRMTDAALAALDNFMAYHAYQGDNPKYRERVEKSTPYLSAYSRVRATKANERQLDLIAMRLASGAPALELPAALDLSAADEPKDTGRSTRRKA